jgi:hypothetical protein
VFEGDCCLIYDYIFFASNGVAGMKITKNLVKIFREA